MSTKQLYTVAEVNELLPQVATRWETVMQLRSQLKALYQALEEAGSPPGQPMPADPSPKVARDRAVFDGLAETLKDEVEQIAALGCVIRDIETGLCDWEGEHEGRIVWLCWCYGERECGWWHELEAGFRGRRPISELRPIGTVRAAGEA
jgi:hypothetical protein